MKRGLTVIGLTGSIGMGKSTAARMLKRMGVPVFDADAAVHRMMAVGGEAVRAVEVAFPGVVVEGAVDRQLLGGKVFGDAEARRRLERIIHPRVHDAEVRFLARAARERRGIVVRDVPLLFETGGDKRCDVAVVVSAPEHLQRQRVLARPNMTAEKLAFVRKAQMPDAEKRRRADYVVPTGLGYRPTWRALVRMMNDVRARRARGLTAG